MHNIENQKGREKNRAVLILYNSGEIFNSGAITVN
jgi:hypothetical protein